MTKRSGPIPTTTADRGRSPAEIRLSAADPTSARSVRFGSYLAVPLTSGGGLLSGVKLKEDQKLTLGSKVGLPWKGASQQSLAAVANDPVAFARGRLQPPAV